MFLHKSMVNYNHNLQENSLRMKNGVRIAFQKGRNKVEISMMLTSLLMGLPYYIKGWGYMVVIPTLFACAS